MEKKYLFEELKLKAFDLGISKPEIPEYIKNNLRFSLFDWQEQALINFLLYENIKEKEQDIKPTHLLFNMATGTGKTLLMAALILHYYQKGYRSFIFFVNQNNIVGKTEENLINPTHNKFLFQQKVVIDDKTIRIKKVEIFSRKTDDIEILFTSIHKLHNAVYLVKENSPYLDDLQKRSMVMLGDEAHHLNADTKKKKGQRELELVTELKDGASEADVEKSWEHTVIQRLLNKDGNDKKASNENVLLEFTATVPKDKLVGEKYIDKTIIQFPLEKFLAAGYTKEINLVSSNLDRKKRILQALLFNWYRHKIAAKNNISNFKPVILFRSKFIEDSEGDYKFFIDVVKNLKPQDFNFLNDIKKDELFSIIETYERGKSRIIDIKRFIEEENANILDIIQFIQYYFREDFCLVTNSKDKSAKGERGGEKTTEAQNKLLNSLEDKHNHIRAIFTVKRLTEGWDVLNLFDIVRMYEGQNVGGSNTKTPEATTQEIQLIGRGVRYFPFKFQDKQENKRKFDANLKHELRVLEEFYYHSDDEHRYLSELTKELKRKGFIDDNKKIKYFGLKDDKGIQSFFNSIQLWKNEPIVNPARRKQTLIEMKENFDFTYKIKNAIAHETRVELSKEEDTTRLVLGDDEGKAILIEGKSPTLKHFPKHIAQKAINIKAKKEKSVLRFSKLKEELDITSVEDIFNGNKFGNFPIKVIAPKSYNKVDDISNEEQLKILLGFFDKVEFQIMQESNPFLGGEFEHRKFSDIFGGIKEKSVEITNENKQLEEELLKKDWYVLNGFNGTSEEVSLINFLKDTMVNLKENYEKVFLLRNEEVYKIFDFDKGRGFQPDFLLFLKEHRKNLFYQIFIEPKGDWASDKNERFEEGKEGWKEIFLKQISEKYGDGNVLTFETKDYKLIGFPLYNEKNRKSFEEQYNKILEVKVSSSHQ